MFVDTLKSNNFDVNDKLYHDLQYLSLHSIANPVAHPAFRQERFWMTSLILNTDMSKLMQATVMMVDSWLLHGRFAVYWGWLMFDNDGFMVDSG